MAIVARGISAAPDNLPKSKRSEMEVVIVTPKGIAEWHNPPFQRPLKETQKVLELIEHIRADGGIIPDIITLGVLDKQKYLLDGQHRVYAFMQSGVEEGLANVRLMYFDSMGDMAEAFDRINGRLVNMSPDDRLRAYEYANPFLADIRKKCSFVGYGQIRRNPSSPILSMSLALRAWFGAASETPKSCTDATTNLVRTLNDIESAHMIDFLKSCWEAWGADDVNRLLWRGLNLTVCCWIYRKVVVSQYSPKTTRISLDQFRRCLMEVSTSSKYLDWLQGRQLSERDRSPAYDRLKTLFVRRIYSDTGKRVLMPSPEWSHSGGTAAARSALV